MIKRIGKKLWLILMVGIGFILRIMACFWGFPYLLHPDEEYIVERTIDMIDRSSWEANVYEWPGHLLIKIDSIIFSFITSYKYHDVPLETFAEHRIMYYYAARFVTCLFGTAMIILAYLIADRIKEGLGKWAALFFAFYPVFIKHSGYATTDIPLAALFMLMIYLSMRYIEKTTDIRFYVICAVVGASMSTKYPGTVFVAFPIYLAFREGILKKDWKFVVKKAIQAAATVFLTLMFIAPNLVTNLQQVLEHVVGEAEYEIAGAINHGYFGNLLFYVNNMSERGGIILIILAMIGLIWCLIGKTPQNRLLVVAFCYTLFLCFLNLQLERWGMPVYAAFWLLAMAGIAGITEYLKDDKRIKSYGKWVLNAVVALLLLNCITGGIRQAVALVVKENRVRALDYCQENSITKDNARYDGYTPFDMDAVYRIKVPLDENGKLKVGDDKRYYILSGLMYERYFVEPVSEKSKKSQVRYLEIWDKCKLLAEWKEYDKNSCFSLLNSYYNALETYKFLTGSPSGATISIYEAP